MIKHFTALAALTAILILAGCATQAEPRPDWLDSYPSDPASFIGIGGSATGNEADDREAAMARARADLAAQIAVDVRAELEVEATADSAGSSETQVRQSVEQSVAQNLQAVEVVETWFDREAGYWVYLRMSKAAWRTIRMREVQELRARAESLLDPYFGPGGSGTPAVRLTALEKARSLLAASPYAPIIRTEFFGSPAIFLDAVESLMVRLLSAIDLTSDSELLTVPAFRPFAVEGVVLARDGREIPGWPVVLSLPDGSSLSTTTDPDGRFVFDMPALSRTGRRSLSAGTDLAALGVDPDRMGQKPALDEIGWTVVVEPLEARLVPTGDLEDLAGLEPELRNLFADSGLPLQWVNEGGVVEILWEWEVFDFPKSTQFENAPLISQVSVGLSYRRDGALLFTTRAGPEKDGGLSREQARQRAARRVLAVLADSPDIFRELGEALRL